MVSLSDVGRSSNGRMSALLRTRMMGLPTNRARRLWRRLICSVIVFDPDERSITYIIDACRCASAVTLCISITFRSSRGWSRIPGVSITCHLTYLYSMCPNKSERVVKAYGWTSNFAWVMSLTKEDLPTLGKPQRIKERVVGSICGSRERSLRTCSR